jgi:hypothetical protein
MPGAGYWRVLGCIFLFLGIDEATMLHERLIKPLRSALDTSGLLYFAWVIPYGVFMLVVLFAFLKFLLTLPARIRYLILAAGGIYVTGVLIFEMIGARHADLHSTRTVTYAVLVTIEESLEMVGLILFVYALLAFIALKHRDLRISFADS